MIQKVRIQKIKNMLHQKMFEYYFRKNIKMFTKPIFSIPKKKSIKKNKTILRKKKIQKQTTILKI